MLGVRASLPAVYVRTDRRRESSRGTGGAGTAVPGGQDVMGGQGRGGPGGETRNKEARKEGVCPVYLLYEVS
jgi:hypothetical protein